MKIFKYFIDFDKEGKWLEEMARNGYQFKGKSFGYNFSRVKPEAATIKIDYRIFNKKKDFIDYCTLFEDSGWQHVAGTKNSGAQYFKKMNSESAEDIFSDRISKAGKYKRLSDMFIQLAVCYLPIFIVMISTELININAIVNPKLLYLTPGLWERSGASFLEAFLFETPFALSRGLGFIFFPLTITIFLIFALKAQKLYNTQMIKRGNFEQD